MFTIISDSCGLFDLGQQRQHPDAHLESVESMKVMDVEGLCVTCFGISGMKTQKYPTFYPGILQFSHRPFTHQILVSLGCFS